METAHVRRALLEALRAAVPGVFDEDQCRSFLAGELDVALDGLDMDSLARMEFCIAIELSTGVTLLPAQLADLATTQDLERRIRQAQE